MKTELKLLILCGLVLFFLNTCANQVDSIKKPVVPVEKKTLVLTYHTSTHEFTDNSNNSYFTVNTKEKSKDINLPFVINDIAKRIDDLKNAVTKENFTLKETTLELPIGNSGVTLGEVAMDKITWDFEGLSITFDDAGDLEDKIIIPIAGNGLTIKNVTITTTNNDNTDLTLFDIE